MKAGLRRQRGAIAKNIGIALAGIAVFIVVVIAALLYFAEAGVEAILEARAEHDNEDRGAMLESFLRFDGSEAKGSRLIKRFTLVDDWEDRIDPEMLALFDGQSKTIETLAQRLAQAVAGTVCEETTGLEGLTFHYVTEIREEKSGNTIAQAQATSTEC